MGLRLHGVPSCLLALPPPPPITEMSSRWCRDRRFREGKQLPSKTCTRPYRRELQMLVFLPGKEKESEQERKHCIVRETALPIRLLGVLRKKYPFQDTCPQVPEAEASLH